MTLPHDKAIKCDHVKNTAHWINHRRARKFSALYDDPALAMREFGGAIVSSTMSAFRKDEITRMFEAERVRTTSAPSVIFIAADNCGGGSSHMAITSGYFAADGTFVVSDTRASIPSLSLFSLQFYLRLRPCCWRSWCMNPCPPATASIVTTPTPRRHRTNS